MKILLMTPFMSYKDRWGQYYKGAGDTFPQGIGSIAGYLEQNEILANVIEPDIEGMDINSFKSFLKEKKYNLIGISAFTTNIIYAYETAKIIKNVYNDTLVAIGGAHPTLFPEQTLQECREIDFVITHEGEEPFLSLITALNTDLDFSMVPNLYFKENDLIIKSDAKVDWLDLDELPMFPFHKFDMNKYIPAPSLRKVLPTFNYMAQRGCPYQCSFCDTRTHGKKVRYRSVDLVINDLKLLKSTYSIKGVIFEGSNFTMNPVWIRDLCNKMIDEKVDLSWYCMGRVDLDNELLPLMKKAGLWCMSFGIESANSETLKRMQKQISIAKVRKTITSLQKLKVRSIGSFILGYPGETEEDVIRTIDFACELNIDVAVFFIPVPYPGTKMYSDAIEDGGLKDNLQWKDFSAWLDHNNPIYRNPLIGEKHVNLYNYAFKKFYTRPKYILHQIKNLNSIDDFKRMFQGFKSVKGLIYKYFFRKNHIIL